MPNTPLILWLRDAYAMEQGLIPLLQDHAGDAQHHPELHARLTSHLEQTRGHAELLRSCLHRLGADPTLLKAAPAKTTGYLNSLAGAGADDQVIKNVQMDYGIEQYEIACYRALAQTARAVGDDATARICDGILREEQDQARYLETHLSQLVQDYVMHAVGQA